MEPFLPTRHAVFFWSAALLVCFNVPQALIGQAVTVTKIDTFTPNAAGRAGPACGAEKSLLKFAWSSVAQGYDMPPSKSLFWRPSSVAWALAEETRVPNFSIAEKINTKFAADATQQIRHFHREPVRVLPKEGKEWLVSRNVA